LDDPCTCGQSCDNKPGDGGGEETDPPTNDWEWWKQQHEFEITPPTSQPQTYQHRDKYWESDFFALTYAATSQFLRAVLIRTQTPIDLIVMNNRGAQQRISLDPRDDIQRINLNFRGELFKLGLLGKGLDTNISSLSAVVAFG